MKYPLPSLVAVFLRVASPFMRRRQRIKGLLHICTSAFQQPHVHYRMALTFATILAFLLGWPLFLSMFSHVLSMCIRCL